MQQAGSSALAAWALSSGAHADAIEAAVLALQQPARRPEALTRAQLQSLEAITDAIIPADDTPGARAAGAAWFVDRLVARWVPEQKAAVIGAIDACDRAAVAAGAKDLALFRSSVVIPLRNDRNAPSSGSCSPRGVPVSAGSTTA